MKLLLITLLISTTLFSQTFREDFTTVNGAGDYTNNVYYEALSPTYNFSGWSEVMVQFKVVSSLRNGDVFAIFYLDGVDNNWYGWNLSNLNGTYTVTIPITAVRISFDLNTFGGAGGTSSRYAHVDWIEFTNNIALPITLLSFTGEIMERYNVLRWSTASEMNNDYFTLYKSYDGINWDYIDETPGQGNSSVKYDYTWRDFNWEDETYYKLYQTDYNGVSEELGIVFLKRKEDRVIKVYNIIGQEMDWCANCVVLELMESGKVRKRYRE